MTSSVMKYMWMYGSVGRRCYTGGGYGQQKTRIEN